MATADQIARRANRSQAHIGTSQLRAGLAETASDLSRILSRLLLNTIATFILVIAIGLSVLATLPVLGGYRSVVVSSGSMEPAIHTADVVVTGSPETNQVGVGSVIDYQTANGTRIHRVIEVQDSGYVTQGDANPTPDSEVPTTSDVLGVGLYVVPLVGLPPIWADERAWHKLLLTLLVLGASTYFAREEWLFPPSKAAAVQIPIRRVERTFSR